MSTLSDSEALFFFGGGVVAYSRVGFYIQIIMVLEFKLGLKHCVLPFSRPSNQLATISIIFNSSFKIVRTDSWLHRDFL